MIRSLELLYGEKGVNMAFSKIIDVLEDSDAFLVDFEADVTFGFKRLYPTFVAELEEGYILQDSLTSEDIIKDDLQGVS